MLFDIGLATSSRTRVFGMYVRLQTSRDESFDVAGKRTMTSVILIHITCNITSEQNYDHANETSTSDELGSSDDVQRIFREL